MKSGCMGCGSDQYSVELARKGADKLVGIAQNMLELCKRNTQQENVRNRRTFPHTDISEYNPGESFAAGIGLFDYVNDPSLC